MVWRCEDVSSQSVHHVLLTGRKAFSLRNSFVTHKECAQLCPIADHDKGHFDMGRCLHCVLALDERTETGGCAQLGEEPALLLNQISNGRGAIGVSVRFQLSFCRRNRILMHFSPGLRCFVLS